MMGALSGFPHESGKRNAECGNTPTHPFNAKTQRRKGAKKRDESSNTWLGTSGLVKPGVAAIVARWSFIIRNPGTQEINTDESFLGSFPGFLGSLLKSTDWHVSIDRREMGRV